MMWKNESVARWEPRTPAIGDGGVTPGAGAWGRPPPAPSGRAWALWGVTGRRRATAMSVVGPGVSCSLSNSTRVRFRWPQLFFDEFTSGMTEVPAGRRAVGDSERAPGKKVNGRSRVIWWRL